MTDTPPSPPSAAPSLLDLDVGFVALPRRLCASAFFRSLRPDERWVFVQMLLAARYGEGGEFWFAGARYPLAPGQFIETEEQIAEAAGSSRKTVRTVRRKARSAGLLSWSKVSAAGHCPSVTTILGYERIRLQPEARGPLTGTPTGTVTGTPVGHQGAPSEQGNPGEPRNQGTLLPSPSAPAESPAVEEVLSAWNAMADRAGLPKSRGAPKVRRTIRTRLRAKGWREAFTEAIAFVETSSFHLGENDRGWKADLGWLLRDGKAEEIAEKAGANAAAPRPRKVAVPAFAPAERFTETRRIVPGLPGTPDYSDPSLYQPVSLRR